MAIRFNIPEVAVQKGPTCWYYATKMLMRFHELIGPGQQLEAEWKSLHLVRKAITQLDSSKKRKEDIRDKLTEWMQKEPDGGKRAELREARLKLESATSTGRFHILDAFFKERVKSVQFGNREVDIQFLQDSLRSYGPLYASIYRLGAAYAMTDFDYVRDPMAQDQERYVYKLDGKCVVGGRHAVVIAGVDDNGNVYYKDPHTPHRFIMVHWNVLKPQLNSPGGSMGSSLFGRINCPSCSHLNRHA
ncbi:hypothetical protein ATI61_108382 [Archangium gephyra]|uniref:Uncharacterized protein n=1 Tax=Archangium gephyra TaxID=48 RepID=A0AAC8Q838_9BACT|nr:hypothetical protein [Archangium gephyra]AKJ02228.1 Hypothetical protein AA314_03854 [Archangium gephyra]REG28840.1 hypothetical protein ATI61_108382 [Archangium gephyra]